MDGLWAGFETWFAGVFANPSSEVLEAASNVNPLVGVGALAAGQMAQSDVTDVDNGTSGGTGLAWSTWGEIAAVIIILFLVLALIHEVREI